MTIKLNELMLLKCVTIFLRDRDLGGFEFAKTKMLTLLIPLKHDFSQIYFKIKLRFNSRVKNVIISIICITSIHSNFAILKKQKQKRRLKSY